MFCAGHSADQDGDIVIHGGTRYHYSTVTPTYCTPQPKFSYVYIPNLSCWSENLPMLAPTTPPPHQTADLLDFHNHGYWYPGSVRLPDGRVGSIGGGSSPVTSYSSPNVCHDQDNNYFIDGFQILDKATATWSGAPNTQWWFTGLPGNYPRGTGTVEFDFNYYPLVSLIPTTSSVTIPSHIFAAVVSDNRGSNELNLAGYLPKRSPSGLMGLHATWPTNGSWGVHPSQITVPNTTTPRNLLYPNGFLWPMHLDQQGLPLGPTRFVVLGGTDQNKYLSGTAASGPTGPTNPPHPDGGRPALDEVYVMDQPEAPGAAWTSSALPNLTLARIFSNAVILPDEQLFVVGGSAYDFLPTRRQGNSDVWRRERIADPIFFPEMLDLSNPAAQWVLCSQHTSPRLYHSMALLLPDARVLVCGGYHGFRARVNPAWNPPQSPPSVPQFLISAPEHHTFHDFTHSDIEIFSPDYLFAGSRPQITAVNSGNPISYGAGNGFEVHVVRAGSTTPAADIGSVCLISPGAVTHHYDWDQRFVKLHRTSSPAFPNRLVVTPPANSGIAPPGWYMLFVVTDPAVTNGVKIPSVAAFVQLR